MKARSRKFLGVAAAAIATACVASAVQATPAITYEIVPSTTSVSGSGGDVTFNVLALVNGTDLTTTGLLSGQFSLVQTPAGVSDATITAFSFDPSFSDSASNSTSTASFSTAPSIGTGVVNLGAANGGTGSANDTVIAYGSVSNSGPSASIPAHTSSGSANVFTIGSGTLHVPAGETGGSVSLAVVPRVGLGNLIKPQVAEINGTLSAFAGNDAANVASTPATISVAVNQFPALGDFNGDGGFDASDVDGFVAALSEGDPFSQFIADNDATFFATYGFHLTEAGVNFMGDFNGDGGFDASDVDGFVAALSGGAVLQSAALSAVAVPEPTTMSLLLVPALLLGRRRNRAK